MKYFKSINSIKNLTVFLCCLSFSLFGQKKTLTPGSSYYALEHGNDTLAIVGNKIITVHDSRERSEFTVRPQNFKNKNITLNNLILEKILSLETGHDAKSTLNPGIHAFLKGIKEQEMRAQLYYKVAYNKVKPDTAELKKAYKLSTREYELEFYRLPNKKFANRVDSAIHSSPEKSDSLFKEIEDILGKKPVHTTKFNDDDDDAIHKSLYTDTINLETVLGPIKLSDGSYIVMKVLKWTDYPLITGEEQQARWNEVNDIVHLRKAGEQWRSFQADVMKGKRLEFDKHTFDKLSKWAMERYLATKKSDSMNVLPAELEIKKPDINFDTPLFTFDDKTWTLQEVREIIRSHPLVYRTTELDSSNFRQQFKYAIIDLMRDYSLTKVAYKRSLDKDENVKNTINMWKDSFLADNKAKAIVDEGEEQGVVDKNDQSQLSKFWNSRVDELKKKYGQSIWINYSLLDRIELTKIDMIAMKPGFPFPMEVPHFPAYTVSGNLDYATLKKPHL